MDETDKLILELTERLEQQNEELSQMKALLQRREQELIEANETIIELSESDLDRDKKNIGDRQTLKESKKEAVPIVFLNYNPHNAPVYNAYVDRLMKDIMDADNPDGEPDLKDEGYEDVPDENPLYMVETKRHQNGVTFRRIENENMEPQ